MTNENLNKYSVEDLVLFSNDKDKNIVKLGIDLK